MPDERRGRSWWGSRRLRTRLTMLVAVPVAALTWFAGVAALEAKSELDQADRTVESTKLSSLVGDLIHRTQIERGLTVAFLASDGSGPDPRLDEARQAVDASRTSLDQLLAEATRVDPAIVDTVVAAVADFDALATTRSEVDDRRVPASEVAAHYTAVIDSALSGLQVLVTVATDPSVTRRLTGYLDLTKAKEEMGLQRAQLNRVIAAGDLSEAERDQVGRHIDRRDTYVDSFVLVAAEPVAASWRDLRSQPAFTDAEAVESALLSEGLLPDGERWWMIATARLEATNDFLRNLAHGTALEAADQADAARRDLIVALTTLVTVLAAVVAISAVITRGITVPLELDSSRIASASEQLAAVSSQMTASAAVTSGQAGEVAHSSDEVSSNMHSVASAATELAASITDVARSSNEAAAIASSGADLAGSAAEMMARLSDSSMRIGGVVSLISSIAKQTNLLALNATIEAARAGQSGKGFAVVANEVKDLSGQVTKATAEISTQVAEIQADAAAAGDALAQVTEVMVRVNQTQETIAAAVRDQIAATEDIDHNVHRAAQRTDEITATIETLAQGAEEFARCATETRGAAADLARTAHELTALVAGGERPVA